MKIEIWSDVVCPFCYIGKRHLEKALEQLPDLDVNIIWKSFELDPNTIPLEPSEVVKRLGDQGIWIRDLAVPSCLRACTHVCSNDEELQALTNAIQHVTAPEP